MITNCKNCGAPLKSHKCEYCGTNYTINYDLSEKTKQDYDIPHFEYVANGLKNVIDYNANTATTCVEQYWFLHD